MNALKNQSSPKQKENPEELKKYFDHWSVFHKIASGNYTHHREVYRNLRNFIMENFLWDFSLADLGCGDAEFTSKILDGLPVSKYTGVDLSGVALNLAKQNMQGITCEKQFIRDDFSKVAAAGKLDVDIIWAGLSLHHLALDQKEEFISNCRRTLGFHGYLLCFEPCLMENEDRDAYLDRWWKICRTEWTALSNREKKETCEHVFSNDYPESFSMMKKIGGEHGFQKVLSLYKTPDNLCRMLCFVA